MPLSISTRFLTSLLNSTAQVWKEDDFERLYQEILVSFQQVFQNIESSKDAIRIQLLEAANTLKTKSKSMREINRKKEKFLKKLFVIDFIKKVKISLCITGPSSALSITELFDGKKSFSKGSNTMPTKISIIIRNEEGCIHEKLNIARELAASILKFFQSKFE